MSLAIPVGLILSGLLSDRIGVNNWFLISGIVVIGIGAALPIPVEVRNLDSK